MSSIEKIVDAVLRQAEEQAEAELSEARKKADSILASGQAEREHYLQGITNALDEECREIARQAADADERRRRLALLEARGGIIDETIAGVKQTIAEMSDGVYADFLFQLFIKNAHGEGGAVRFTPGEFARLPEDFFSRCKEESQNPSLTFAGDLEGESQGFVIDYGLIIENCLIDDLLESMSQTIRDRAYAVLSGNR